MQSKVCEDHQDGQEGQPGLPQLRLRVLPGGGRLYWGAHSDLWRHLPPLRLHDDGLRLVLLIQPI